MEDILDSVVRGSGGRIMAALAARFRDLDVAEDAFGDACEAATRNWRSTRVPADPAAWLYRVAVNRALDAVRRRNVRMKAAVLDFTPPQDELEDEGPIPEERLRLIFVCCHPAIGPEARAALTLRLVCGLSAREIAAAFLVTEPTMLQRLTRAKRKIAVAGVPFEVPGPSIWGERLEAVLTTLEIAYSKAHADAAGTGPHAGYANEMLHLTATLAAMVPEEGEVLGLAALVHYAEARRPARLDTFGAMIPLSEQDPARWRRSLITDGDRYLQRAHNCGAFGTRALTAALHGIWCARRSLDDAPPWKSVLGLYNTLLEQRDDVVIRLNRAVALAEVVGVQEAFDEIESLRSPALEQFQPWHAVRADLLRRLGRSDESRLAYDSAIALTDGAAEQAWLRKRKPSWPPAQNEASQP